MGEFWFIHCRQFLYNLLVAIDRHFTDLLINAEVSSGHAVHFPSKAGAFLQAVLAGLVQSVHTRYATFQLPAGFQ